MRMLLHVWRVTTARDEGNDNPGGHRHSSRVWPRQNTAPLNTVQAWRHGEGARWQTQQTTGGVSRRNTAVLPTDCKLVQSTPT